MHDDSHSQRGDSSGNPSSDADSEDQSNGESLCMLTADNEGISSENCDTTMESERNARVTYGVPGSLDNYHKSNSKDLGSTQPTSTTITKSHYDSQSTSSKQHAPTLTHKNYKPEIDNSTSYKISKY